MLMSLRILDTIAGSSFLGVFGTGGSSQTHRRLVPWLGTGGEGRDSVQLRPARVRWLRNGGPTSADAKGAELCSMVFSIVVRGSKLNDLRDACEDDEDDSFSDSTAVIDAREIIATASAPGARRHLLVGAQGAQLGRVVPVQGAEFVVGRAADCALWLDDSGVSRRHARLVLSAETYTVEDLESANGTYIGGERIATRELRDGDVIQFGPAAVFRYSVADSQQEAMLQHLYEASVSDALTGIYNREHLDKQLRNELSYALRHRVQLALLMLDIDHFKRINDSYGHQAGDRVLVELVAAVGRQLRAEDTFARYGGEEFSILLRTTALAEAASVGERIRTTVEGLRVEFDRTIIKLTVSVGCASLDCCIEPTEGELIAVADRRLYRAKRTGRNCVVAEG